MYRARTEFVLHVENFRNVDLFQQGIYFLKFQIFNEDEEKVYYANPYHFESRGDLEAADTRANFHRLLEPQLFDENASFVTKTFFVRYAEETVTFRHVIKFRTEVDVQKLHQNSQRMSVIFDPNKPVRTNQFVDNEFYLRVELYYAQPPQHNFVRAANSAEIMKDEVSRYANKFKCVQTKLFQINKSLGGQSTFIPIQFDREYTSLCSVTLHSSVIDFKFSNKMEPAMRIKLHSESDDEQDNNHVFMENGILVEKKMNLEAQSEQDNPTQASAAASSKNSSPDKKRAKRKAFIPHNVAEYFFFNDNGQLEISEDSIRQTYSAYTTLLANAHK